MLLKFIRNSQSWIARLRGPSFISSSIKISSLRQPTVWTLQIPRVYILLLICKVQHHQSRGFFPLCQMPKTLHQQNALQKDPLKHDSRRDGTQNHEANSSIFKNKNYNPSTWTGSDTPGNSVESSETAGNPKEETSEKRRNHGRLMFLKNLYNSLWKLEIHFRILILLKYIQCQPMQQLRMSICSK